MIEFEEKSITLQLGNALCGDELATDNWKLTVERDLRVRAQL